MMRNWASLGVYALSTNLGLILGTLTIYIMGNP
jgi:hypothetical protein